MAHWKMVHVMRPVWQDVGDDNQLGRPFPPLTYTAQDATALRTFEAAPRTVRGGRDLISVGLQYGNWFGYAVSRPQPSSQPTTSATTASST